MIHGKTNFTMLIEGVLSFLQKVYVNEVVPVSGRVLLLGSLAIHSRQKATRKDEGKET